MPSMRDASQRESFARLQDAQGRIADLETKEYPVADAAGIAASIHGATLDTTPLDADEVPTLNSVGSFALLRTTWASIKAFLKTYFDTLYMALTGAQTVAGAKKFTSAPEIEMTSANIIIDATTGAPAILLQEAGTTKWRFIYDPSGDFFSFSEFAVADWVRVVDGTGFVGFGASITPLAQLHVSQATLGALVQRLQSTSTGDDPIQDTVQGRIATTDATVTTLHTFTIPASTTVMIEAAVIARRTGGASGTAEDGAGYILRGVYKNVAGVATLIAGAGGGTTVVGESQAGWDAIIDVTGATARVRVTGATGNNISWHMTAKVWPISS